jgi:hypothetical protein
MIFKFRIFTVEQSGKIQHPNFQTFDYNYQNVESKCAHAVAMICRQRYCSQENGDTCEKKKAAEEAKCVLWFN